MKTHRALHFNRERRPRGTGIQIQTGHQGEEAILAEFLLLGFQPPRVPGIKELLRNLVTTLDIVTVSMIILQRNFESSVQDPGWTSHVEETDTFQTVNHPGRQL